MNEVKYEPIFGDQSLFDGAPENAEIAALYSPINGYTGEDIMKHFRCLNDAINYKCISRYSAKVAQRRIIPEPKRWTQADRLAGVLPEVGSECQYCDGKRKGIVKAVDGDEACIQTEQGLYISYLYDVEPIETPQEKAQRERDEWAKKASNWIDADADGANLVGVLQMRRFYDALLSGELPMPSKE